MYEMSQESGKCESAVCQTNHFLSKKADCVACSVECDECAGPSAKDCIDCAKGAVWHQGACTSTCPKGMFMLETKCGHLLPTVMAFSFAAMEG